MADAKPRPATTLHVIRTFAAAREKVFRAWTDPEALKRWWIPRDGFSVPQVNLDLRVGGTYRIAMQNSKGEVFHLTGTYREVRPPEGLVYTWRWQGTESDIGETLVTVEFHDLGRSTEVVITHELFPDTRARELHDQGWAGCLSRLAHLVGGQL
jgi:uncharacterized protein YndB with AHSA1/START domain